MRRREPDASARLPRDVWLLSAIGFFVALGFGVMSPVLPVFARHFGVSRFAVGAVISAFALMRLVTSPACARINRTFGERRVLGVGILIVAASSAAAGWANSYGQLLAMRGLGGIGSAMFTVAAITLLLRAVPPELRGRASATYSGGFLVGGMAGPALGGLVAGISLRAPFFFYAGTLVVAAAVGLLMLSGHVASAPDAPAPTPPPPMRRVVRDIRYQAACLTNFAQGWQSVGVRSTLVPVLVVETLHYSARATGIVFAVAAIAQALFLGPAGRATDRIGRRPLLIAAGLITGLGALATPFAPTIWVLTAILAVYGLGSAMHATAPTAVVGDVIGRAGGLPIAIFSMTSDLGTIAGPLVAGKVADDWNTPAAFTIGAGLLLLGSLVSAFIPRRVREVV